MLEFYLAFSMRICEAKEGRIEGHYAKIMAVNWSSTLSVALW